MIPCIVRRSKSEKVTEFSLFFLRFLSLFWLFLSAIHSDKAFRKALLWRTFWRKLLTLAFDLNPKKFSDFFEGKSLVEELSGLVLVIVGEEVEDFWGDFGRRWQVGFERIVEGSRLVGIGIVFSGWRPVLVFGEELVMGV